MSPQRESSRTDEPVAPVKRRRTRTSLNPSLRDPRSRVSERYEERLERIVDIGARVFAKRGFHATTVDDLVEATGLQRGGLYHYIDGKEDLLIKIHERFIDPLLEDAREVEAEGAPPDATLRKLGQVLMYDIANYLPQVTVFLQEWRVIERSPRWSAIRHSRKEFEDVISRVLQRGVNQGMFDVADVRVATLAFLGMFNWSHHWFRDDGRFAAEELADQFCQTFLRGIQRPRRAARRRSPARVG